MWNKKEMSQLDAMLTRVLLTLTFDRDLWPWIFKVKLYLENGRPDCHGTKGTGVDRMPWCETLWKWVNWMLCWGWVGLWGFLWWAPSAKRKDHHGVSSGWSSVWHHSNTGLSSTQYEQIPIILGIWPFWLTPFFFSVNNMLVGLWLNCIFSVDNYSLSSGWHIIAA